MVILGLGNPGKNYINNRHNIGAKVISELISRACLTKSWKRKYFRATEIEICGRTVIVARSSTFMNESGKAALALCTSFDIKPDEILLVYDDVNLALGKIRIRKKGSSGGHKGIQSVIESIGTEEFPRIKLGIGMPPEGMDLVEYVLSDFTEEEKPIARQMVKDAADAIELILKEGIEKAMSIVNGKG
ncbi:MAG: aminoacyl-tRNA hydrolase [Candidatus Ratteibacteria bacterium]